jgi:hypothetical protein
MGEARSFASLSSGLLARKGGAKPAMRPQGFGTPGVSLDDLGWDDMGYAQAQEPDHYEDEAPEHVPSSIAALTPSPKADAPAPAPAVPEVVEQQRAIETHFGRPKRAGRTKKATVAEIVSLPPRARAEAGSKDKAAFTLRLDKERHLKLRLACAVTNRSAQQIVTDALDELLESLPELDALARRVPANLGRRT